MKVKKQNTYTITLNRQELKLLISKLDDGNSFKETDLLLELQDLL